MNKSFLYNRQSKTEIEEISIHQNMESQVAVTASIPENKYQWIPDRIPSNNIWK